MATFAAPGIKLVGFKIGLSFPGQNVTSSRLTGRIDAVNRGPGLWTGQAQWMPDATSQTDKKELLRWLAQLRGQTHQTQIVLPACFGPTSAPTDDYAAVTAGRNQTSSGEVTVQFDASAGSWDAGVGDLVNIGDRLYVIEAVDGSDYSIMPRALPANGATVEAAAPFIVCTSLNADQLEIGFQSTGFDRVVFDWVEHIA